MTKKSIQYYYNKQKFFDYVINEYYEILSNSDHDVFMMAVIIRCIGLFAKAIKKIKGEEFLKKVFERLIEICKQKVIKYELIKQEFRTCE